VLALAETALFAGHGKLYPERGQPVGSCRYGDKKTGVGRKSSLGEERTGMDWEERSAKEEKREERIAVKRELQRRRVERNKQGGENNQ
jgi:hypothetical protein